MNKYNKKRFPILFKVFVVHLFIILIIDINISAVVNKDLKSLNEINKAKFLNLKSISLEELEKKRKAVKEKKRKLEALKKKRELEKEKKKKLAAQNKKDEIDRLKKDEETKLADYELKKLENELMEIDRIESLIKQQILRNAQLTDAESRYILTIKAKIENNWLIPHDAKHDRICTAIVNQLPSGKVTSVEIHGCQANVLYIESLVNAVWKSSPLPVAPDIEVFQENIVLQFEGQNK
ncbi:MAG: TonB C-terminal domain-containing protein [Gammaproteobacteria bacterium]|nr:TonB C-terminal domain-containing protein [Gammaproteobacteria bacterium]MBT6754785.1 TonB C-terminal domain-containing protein [Gammaproteobacteria bacterium]